MKSEEDNCNGNGELVFESDASFESNKVGHNDDLVPGLEAATTSQTLLWVSPQTFVDNAQRVNDYMGSIESRVAAIELRERAARAREAAFLEKMTKQVDERLVMFRDEEIVPFMTSMQTELEAMNAKVERELEGVDTRVGTLAARLEGRLDEHLGKLRENKKATSSALARVAIVETKTAVAEANITHLKRTCSETKEHFERTVVDIEEKLVGLRTKLSGAIEDIGVIIERDKAGSTRTSDLERRMKMTDETASALKLADAGLDSKIEQGQSLLTAASKRLTVDLNEGHSRLEVKIKRIELDATDALGPEIETIRNLQTDVARLFILADDHHRHDADDDPLVVHEKALRSLTRTVNSHGRILANRQRQQRSPSKTAVLSADAPSTPPSDAGTQHMPSTPVNSSVPSSAASSPGAEGEYNGDDPLSVLKRADYSQRLLSDTSLINSGKRWRPKSAGVAKVSPHGAKSPGRF